MTRERYSLTVEALPEAAPAEVARRRVIKALLRHYGFRLLRVAEVPAGAPAADAERPARARRTGGRPVTDSQRRLRAALLAMLARADAVEARARRVAATAPPDVARQFGPDAYMDLIRARRHARAVIAALDAGRPLPEKPPEDADHDD